MKVQIQKIYQTWWESTVNADYDLKINFDLGQNFNKWCGII